jgi:Cdc6-like AAA superfamily ATPase
VRVLILSESKSCVSKRIKDISYLYPNKTPPDFPFRNDVIQELDTYVFNAPKQCRQPDHIYLWSPPGQGKSAIFFDKLKNDWKSPYYAANVSGAGSIDAAFSNIFQQITGGEAPRAKTTGELSKKILWALLEKHGERKPIILALDEFDRFLNSPRADDQVIYSFLRPNETAFIGDPKELWVSLVLIGNDPRMPSKFSPLKRRRELALKDGVISDDQLFNIASSVRHLCGFTDARFAIEVLRMAVLSPSEEKEVSDEEVNNAVYSLAQKTFSDKLIKSDIHDHALLYVTIKLYEYEQGLTVKKNLTSFSTVYDVYEAAMEKAKQPEILKEKQSYSRVEALQKIGLVSITKLYHEVGRPLVLTPTNHYDKVLELLLDRVGSVFSNTPLAIALDAIDLEKIKLDEKWKPRQSTIDLGEKD